MATAKIDTSLIQTLADGSHVIQLGSMEIWDGADLALLHVCGLCQLTRDLVDRHRALGVGLDANGAAAERLHLGVAQ